MHSALYTGRLSHHRRAPGAARVRLPALLRVARPRGTRRGVPRPVAVVDAASCARVVAPRRLPRRRHRPARHRRARPRRGRDRSAPRGADPPAHAAAHLRTLLQPGELLLLLRPRRAGRRDGRRRDHQHALGRAPRLRAARHDRYPRRRWTALLLRQAFPRIAVHAHGPGLRLDASASPAQPCACTW